MAIDINLPNIGEDELEVTEILVKIGDTVNINQSLLIIEGDKSSIEIPSPYSGIVNSLHISVGDKVHTGSLILSLKTIKHTHTSVHSSSNQKILTSPYTNNESNLLRNKKKTHKNEIQKNTELHKTEVFNLENNTNFIHATPLIRHIARELGINLSKIKGSGRKGRILKEDLYNYFHNVSTEKISSYSITPNHQLSSVNQLNSEENYDEFGNIKIIELTKIQKISGYHLQKSWSTIPHVTQFDIVDVTNLEKFRKQQNQKIIIENANYKITMLVFIIKAVSKALEKFPRFNSSLSKDNNTLILKKYINIGIAVDTTKGLLVPVIRSVNNKSIIDLSKELSEIAQKARAQNQLTPLDLKGGSFTISNLGGIGGTNFTPIINSPEVAILGVSQSRIQPVWITNKFIPRLMLPLSLSYDHRVIDGADGARFINFINTIISDIRLLLM